MQIISITYDLKGKLKQIIIKPINNGQYFNCYIQYEETKNKEEIKENKNYFFVSYNT